MATTTPRSPSGRASVPGPGGGSAPDRQVGRAAVPVPSAPPSGGYYDDGYDQAGGGYGGYGGGSGGRPPGGRSGGAQVGRRRPRWRKVLLGISLTLLLVLLLGGGGLWLYTRSLDNNMGRIDAFTQASADRPTPGAAGTMNVLILGSDSRDPDAADTNTYRADTIMLMHVPSGKKPIYLISIPRDLWVYVPPSPDGGGDQEAKINAATTFGGVPLMVQTVESYTGVRIDHLMLLDFAGFVEVTDALGGVQMHIEQTITSIHGDNRVFEEGTQQLNGEEALDYIRQRKQFADGDFTRMRNQQQFLKALMDKAASSGTLSNPGKLNAFLQTATRTLTVDRDFSLLGVGWQLRNLRGGNLTFLTSPHAGTGSAGGQSVVFSDDEGAAELYTAVREDRVGQWVADHPDQVRG